MSLQGEEGLFSEDDEPAPKEDDGGAVAAGEVSLTEPAGHERICQCSRLPDHCLALAYDKWVVEARPVISVRCILPGSSGAGPSRASGRPDLFGIFLRA